MNKLQTYGKVNPLKRAFLEVIDRFKINKFTENTLNSRGIGVYVPRLNKVRFTLGLIGVVICIVTPVITPLLVFPLLWGIK